MAVRKPGDMSIVVLQNLIDDQKKIVVAIRRMTAFTQKPTNLSFFYLLKRNRDFLAIKMNHEFHFLESSLPQLPNSLPRE